MAVSHVFSSPVADVTGTVTVFNSQGSTATEYASNIVRPSNWNSVHNQFLTISGNTAGQSTLSGTNIVFAGGPNVTLSANAGTVSISAGAGGAGDGVNIIAAGGSTANSTGTIVFSNSNGVSFGLNGATVTASHNGLTTAALSNHSHGNPTLALTNITGTTASNSAGLTLSLSGVAAQSVQTQGMVSVNGSTGNISFANGNGITFGANASTITASHNGLTTAAASNHSHGASGSNGSFAFQTLSFSNANGVSFGTSAGSAIVASHNGLTTAAQSNHSHGNPQLNLTNLSGTTASNSAGFTLSLSAGNYLTTAAASDHSHGNPSLALTNISGTTASNSAGLTLSLSAAGGGVINQTGPNIAAGTQTGTSGTIVFSNSNGITFGMSNSSIVTAQHNGLTTAAASDHSHGNPTLNLTNISGTTASNSAGFTLSLSAGAGGGGGTATMWWPFNEAVNVMGQQGQGTLNIIPLPTPAPAAGGEVHIDRVVFPIYWSNASNSTGSATLSYWMGLYTKNDSTLSLAHSTSYTTGHTFSGNNSSASYNGIRIHTVPWTTTIGDGRYYVGILSRTTSGGANGTYSQVLMSQMNSNYSGVFGAASNASDQWPYGFGIYSATTSSIPGSIAFTQLRGTGSLAARPPSWFMINGTV